MASERERDDPEPHHVKLEAVDDSLSGHRLREVTEQLLRREVGDDPCGFRVEFRRETGLFASKRKQRRMRVPVFGQVDMSEMAAELPETRLGG